jgi:hypothetical protein
MRGQQDHEPINQFRYRERIVSDLVESLNAVVKAMWQHDPAK